jgi:hypothetical protein
LEFTFVFGAIGVRFIADLSNSSIAIQLVAWIAMASGVFVLLVMIYFIFNLEVILILR